MQTLNIVGLVSCLFTSMEDMDHRDPCLLDVICGASPDGRNCVVIFFCLTNDESYSMFCALCSPMLSFSYAFLFFLNHLSSLHIWNGQKQTKYLKHRVVHYLQPHLWLLHITWINVWIPYSDLSILPEGVLFKNIHVQEAWEQKRINIEIHRSTTVPLRESVSSCAGGHANLLEVGAGVDRVAGYTVPSQPEPEWQWVRRDMFWGMVGTRRFVVNLR